MKKAISKSTIKLMSKLKKKELSDYVTKAILDDDDRKVAIIKQAHSLGCDLVDPYVSAVRNDDLLSLALCLNYGVSVNWSDSDGLSIAHICALSGNEVLLKSLITRGLDINTITTDGLTPFELAIFKKNYECAKEFVTCGIELVHTVKRDEIIDGSDNDQSNDFDDYVDDYLNNYCNESSDDFNNIFNSNIYPNIDFNNDPSEDTNEDPSEDPSTDPIVDLTINTITDPTTNPTTDLITDPTTDPTTDSITDLTTDPITDLNLDGGSNIDSTIDSDVVSTESSDNLKDKYEVNVLTFLFEYSDDSSSVGFTDVLKLIVTKLDKLSEANYYELKKLILHKKLNIVQIVLLKFPKSVNKILNNRYTLLSLLIDGGHTELINEFIQKDGTDLDPMVVRPYLHQLVDAYDLVNIIYLLNKQPNHIHKFCEDSRTPVDYLLLNFEEKKEAECMNILEVLIRAGCNLNNRNKLGFRTIETAIQYTNARVIKRLIEAGLDIYAKILKGDEYFPPITNNDILAFAAQVGSIPILDLFLEHNVQINMYQGMPTVMLIAIRNDRKNVVVHLMSNDKIKSICTEPCIKKKLLDYSINTGAANKKIMACFSTTQHINSLKLNVKQTVFNNFEKNFSDLICEYDNYDNHRDTVLLLIDLKLHFLMQCATLKSIDDVGSTINVWMKICTFNSFIYSTCIHDILMGLMAQTMNNVTQTFNNCTDFIQAIYHAKDNDEIKIIFDRLTEICKRNLRKFIKKIKKLQKLIENCQNTVYSNERYSLHYTNSETHNNVKHIDDMLIQLMYPKKQPHYESMHSKLSGINCVLSETDSYIAVCDNDTGITATVFKLEALKKPNKWFDFYCYNIGKDTKCDSTHMFPFILDKKMHHLGCETKSAKDHVNGFGSISMIYFYGTLKINNKFTAGVFEYFIDSTNTLFHRFFRPMAQLSPKDKLAFMKNIPESLCEKFDLN